MNPFAVGLALILAGGVGARALARRPRAAALVFRWGVASGCALALIPALIQLCGHPPAAPGATPVAAPFGIDPLSAWFLLPVLGVGAVAAVYGVSYLGRHHDPGQAGVAHLLVAILLASLAGVVTARSIVAFMVSWEIMAVTAFSLVVFEHDEPGAARAGLIYLVLTHMGTLGLFCMFAYWTGGDPRAWFQDLAVVSSRGSIGQDVPLLFALLAFGIKAGAVPFHFWLPGAHAAAPSHVSALLSGVVLKIGIYGLLRVLTLTGTPPAWWGWTLLALGLASAVLGVLWALAQHDLKRLLAYHSVENIGIILMGLGLGALGSTYHQPGVALLGYAGALLHTLNHALFKSLLFLGAGAVAQATGTREIDRLGGLARRMPHTALLFLVGSVAIVGLPPLNGFVSEWLIFSGLLASGLTTGDLRVAAVTTVGLALTGALALACFAKVFSVVFLGRPRADGAMPAAGEAPGLVLPQWVLAACCIAIGLAPGLVLPAVARVAGLLPGPWDGAVPIPPGDPFLLSMVSAGTLVLGSLAWLAARRSHVARPAASAATWSCAFAATTGRMQYTASSSAAPLLTVFGPLSGNRVERTASGVRTQPLDPILDMLGRPAWKRINHAATELRVLQSGGIRWYLLYTIVCLVALLVYLRYLAPR